MCVSETRDRQRQSKAISAISSLYPVLMHSYAGVMEGIRPPPLPPPAGSADSIIIIMMNAGLPLRFSACTLQQGSCLLIYTRTSLSPLCSASGNNFIIFLERKRRSVNGLQIRECHVFMHSLHHERKYGIIVAGDFYACQTCFPVQSGV